MLFSFYYSFKYLQNLEERLQSSSYKKYIMNY